MSTGRLAGKVAIVTGASKGIGAAIAARFAAEGAQVALCARTGAAVDAVAAEIRAAGGQASATALDVGDHAALAAFVQSTIATHGRLDVVVNNAPSVTYAALTDMDVAAFRRDFHVNVDSTFVTTREALPTMYAQGSGSIINIASVNALLALGNMAAYGAAKAALVHFTRQIAVEAAGRGVRANAIAPGVINTPATTAGFAGPYAAWGEKIAAAVPMGRFGEPAEVAALALFLASDEASYVTGTCIAIDGGKSVALHVPNP
jgi:meso-butanediol dehydrogenase/(S,S)-butanediol dehydrogenase/diacetyl reductase